MIFRSRILSLNMAIPNETRLGINHVIRTISNALFVVHKPIRINITLSAVTK